MKRSRLQRRTPLRTTSSLARKSRPKQGKPLKRKTRMKAINTQRRKKLHAKQYGEKAPWVRSEPCQLARWSPSHVCEHHVVAAHADKTRGAGGTLDHIVGWCLGAEREFHQIGRKSFEELHGVDIAAMTAFQHAEWLEYVASLEAA